VNSVMCLEAMIERIWRCPWRPRSCNSEMHLEAVIEGVWRRTGGHDRSRLEEYLEVVDLEAVDREVRRQLRLCSVVNS
jgi:hypothetical protein